MVMQFSVSTHWNTFRHVTGEAMVEEILGLGVDAVELGYDLRIDMVPGVRNMVQSGAIKVLSVHNFCPVPMGAHRGHPELYTPGSTDRQVRDLAVTHMSRTIAFAAEMGAKVVVAHAGNVDMTRMSRDLYDWCQQGKQFTPAYEKLKLKTLALRDKKAPKQIGYLKESIDRLLPVLAQYNIALAFENLPTWEAIPTEIEMETLMKEYNSPYLKCWFDFGHGQIRQNLGFINAERWAERLSPWLAGMHIHDVKPPVHDHVMPPRGHIPFDRYTEVAQRDVVRVIEPAPGTAAEEIKEAIAFLNKCWQSPATTTQETGKTT
jgi:sugar phosphate isomerase/epimerase